jgi:anti-sigma regulatory factor (Ser/Thr protein kinase)
MATGSYLRAIYRIEARTDGPARARRIVGRELGCRVAPHRLDELKLLVSELVTNGVSHGDGSQPITLDLRVNGCVRCAVTDHGPGPASTGALSDGSDGPWGLKLVERLATSWGLIRAHGATQVWFEISSA